MAINKLDTKGWWKVGNQAIYTPATPCKVEHSNITALAQVVARMA